MRSPTEGFRPGSPCPVTGCAAIALPGYRFRVNGRSRAFCPACGEKLRTGDWRLAAVASGPGEKAFKLTPR
jgi:hypothetical protein